MKGLSNFIEKEFLQTGERKRDFPKGRRKTDSPESVRHGFHDQDDQGNALRFERLRSSRTYRDSY